MKIKLKLKFVSFQLTASKTFISVLFEHLAHLKQNGATVVVM